jgi:dihydroneopterin aldolase
MDKVFIKGLELYTLIGVYDFERNAKQRVLVDLEMCTDLTAAGISDNVDDTLNYAAVAERLAELANKASFKLLEALASQMIDAIMDEFPVSSVVLTMHKPDILKNVQSVGVVLHKQRSAAPKLN